MRARLGPFGIALDNPDVETLAGQVVGCREADNTSTADDHTARVTHEIEVRRERFKSSILIKALASPPKKSEETEEIWKRRTRFYSANGS